jgi:hypothetical protein
VSGKANNINSKIDDHGNIFGPRKRGTDAAAAPNRIHKK